MGPDESMELAVLKRKAISEIIDKVLRERKEEITERAAVLMNEWKAAARKEGEQDGKELS